MEDQAWESDAFTGRDGDAIADAVDAPTDDVNAKSCNDPVLTGPVLLLPPPPLTPRSTSGVGRSSMKKLKLPFDDHCTLHDAVADSVAPTGRMNGD